MTEPEKAPDTLRQFPVPASFVVAPTLPAPALDEDDELPPTLPAILPAKSGTPPVIVE